MHILHSNEPERKGHFDFQQSSPPSSFSDLSFTTTNTGSGSLTHANPDASRRSRPGSLSLESQRHAEHQDRPGPAWVSPSVPTVPPPLKQPENTDPTTPGNAGRHVARFPFSLPVPDYIQADWLLARPKSPRVNPSGRPRRGRRRIGGGLHWAIHQAVILQKASTVILADVVLAQVLWGGEKGRWPRNWRQRLV